jgi:hypothetical protein
MEYVDKKIITASGEIGEELIQVNCSYKFENVSERRWTTPPPVFI